MFVTKSSTPPTQEDLFSGKPHEWSTYDIDARMLRTASLGFRFVEKGSDAAPRLRELAVKDPSALDREKLWRLISVCPDLYVVLARPSYFCNADEQVLFKTPLPEHQVAFGATEERHRYKFSHHIHLHGFTHKLFMNLHESKTGRVDMTVCLRVLSNESSEADRTACSDFSPLPVTGIDISSCGLRLISLDAAFAHHTPRRVIGLPNIMIFQNLPVGGCFQLACDRPVAPERLSGIEIVWTDQE